ncbi:MULTISPECIES: hypothetical protein [unclassified Pseudomonas]|uniref:hypothetical protein n=1 Tax=unclassified Pseudomonas TaxID=196821 RepID=UPI0008771A72|nr:MULTISPECIES: hypothetical protein [unclassified Pseudomonas]SCZ40016.1 hypothetical protein SAMN03159405_04291 [Pseudomonas sp. NFACC44-2]SDA89871.1 hypothetical protein SAMN03159429_05686 [Pseudomonas sp. NFACC51]SDB35606.1 hypothetical protein SAMN03159290_02593 [Pseudomonas sp. NFACC13-1]SDW42125.1 hypothetical protein SAMN03159474_00820 [Pseudomonas sp. NFACC08-1]SFI17097.1 hypothetical protein SAMN03159302_03591 [Pseudomonas sp. NFACC54]
MKNAPATQLSSLSQPKPAAQLADVGNTAAAFFAAWKKGVALAGFTYFGDGSKAGFNKANCRWDLRPIMRLIDKNFEVLSNQERILIAAMVSFHDTQKGCELLKQAGVKGLADLGLLDPLQRGIIASLILHYHGW